MWVEKNILKGLYLLALKASTEKTIAACEPASIADLTIFYPVTNLTTVDLTVVSWHRSKVENINTSTTTLAAGILLSMQATEPGKLMMGEMMISFQIAPPPWKELATPTRRFIRLLLQQLAFVLWLCVVRGRPFSYRPSYS